MDIDLYINEIYCGFFPLHIIEKNFTNYRMKASEMAKAIDWDEVILYAIFAYNEKSSALISVDLMTMRMTYSRYVRLCSKISKNCRMFFIKGR